MQEIQANPAKYVMVFRPSMLASDFGGVLPANSCCLHSRWSGYQESADWKPVAAAVDAANGAVIQAHTSGHIYADDIAGLIRQIQPQLVIPIHTFEPERFREIATNVAVLADGVTWEVGRIQAGRERNRTLTQPCEELYAVCEVDTKHDTLDSEDDSGNHDKQQGE